MMNNEEVRLQCLSLASNILLNRGLASCVSSDMKQPTVTDVIAKAKEINAWVTEEG